jgi:hypothetical protein
MSRALLFASSFMLALACAGPSPASESGGTSTQSGETSTQSGETSTQSGDTSTAEGFVPTEHDLRASCDPFAQDCPDGEKCVPYASTGGNWDANKCVPVLGDGATGEPCTSAGAVEATDDCDASGVCWNVSDVDGELVGTCQPFCAGTPDNASCPFGWYCQLYGDGSRTICERLCDPLAQTCEDGQGCYWVGNSFLCGNTIGDIPAGEPCGYINDCAPGLVCVVPETLPSCAGSSCCTSFCELGLAEPQCDAVPGTECVPFFEQGTAPSGYEHVGICMLP